MTVRTLHDPDAATAARFLRAHLDGHLVTLYGPCTVIYEGRAASTLAEGDRLLVLKPDGSLLVHQTRGVKPVNWQPSGTAFAADVEDGALVVTGLRAKPRELVRVHFNAVRLVTAAKATDGADLDLEGSESDIHGRLRRSPGAIEPGLRIIASELERRRGPMDLVAVDAKGRRVVVEIKRRAAGIKEATQLWRYVERERGVHGDAVRGLLVAPAVSATAARYLADHRLDFVAIDLDALLERTAPRDATQRDLSGWTG